MRVEAKDLVVIGRLGAPYGVKGWQHVQSFTHPIENILAYPHWYVQQKTQWVRFEVVAGRLHGEGVVAQLHHIDDRDKAALLVNCEVAIEREQLPELPVDEFYWKDLEGCRVLNTHGETLGVVRYLYENTGIDIMVVVNEEKEQHIPFILQDTVMSVDLAAKQIIVAWDIVI